jgi:hypothetical protein
MVRQTKRDSSRGSGFSVPSLGMLVVYRRGSMWLRLTPVKKRMSACTPTQIRWLGQGFEEGIYIPAVEVLLG